MRSWFLALVWACAPGEPELVGYQPPAPDAGPPLRGPGGPAVRFADEDLWAPCAWLTGSANDWDHHNLVMPYRGHLVMPWAPEWSNGGLSFFDMSDPCNPEKVGEGTDAQMRETHAIGLLHLPDGPHAGDWAFVNDIAGMQTWDVSDLGALTRVGRAIPTNEDGDPLATYPDSYTRVVLSLFVQYPWVYLASADNGVFIVDAADPTAPVVVHQHVFDPPLRAGGVFALGNRLLVSSAEGSSAEILDISDPARPAAIPGGRFTLTGADGVPVEAYHGNLSGNYALFARKSGGGGVLVYDISNPEQPVMIADILHPDGNGGYVFYDEGFLFTGESSFGSILDARDLSAVSELGRVVIQGDLDTVTPYGNVAIVAVDDKPAQVEGVGLASGVFPWAAEPDATGPTVLAIDPPDGSSAVAHTARIGVGFDEPVEPSSAHAGSIRLRAADGTWVEGWLSAQEGIASFSPKEPLLPDTSYTVEVMADGVTDLNGNPVATTVTSTFRTAP